MAFLETGYFCVAEEYTRGLPHRISDAQLKTDELYSLYMRLDDEKKQAAKLAVRTLEVAGKAGFVAVKFAFLDRDLNPTVETKEIVSGGFINEVQGAVITDPTTEERYAISQAYFKDYFDEQLEQLLAQSNSLSIEG